MGESFELEMYVKLKIPDTTAITCFHALKKMGFNDVKSVSRQDYYKFSVENNNKESFSERIKKTDILANFNKHSVSTEPKKEGNKENSIGILVQSIDNDAADDTASLLSTLKQRLGFKNITSMEKGVFWHIEFTGLDKKHQEERAKEIAEKLLVNKHYQKYVLV